MKYDGPLYAQIAKQLEADILSGRILPGQKLPPIRQIAERFHVNPNTALRAVSELERTGFVQVRQGFGTYAASDLARIEQARRAMADRYIRELRAQLEMLGFSTAEMLDLISDSNKRNEV